MEQSERCLARYNRRDGCGVLHLAPMYAMGPARIGFARVSAPRCHATHLLARVVASNILQFVSCLWHWKMGGRGGRRGGGKERGGGAGGQRCVQPENHATRVLISSIFSFASTSFPVQDSPVYCRPPQPCMSAMLFLWSPYFSCLSVLLLAKALRPSATDYTTL